MGGSILSETKFKLADPTRLTRLVRDSHPRLLHWRSTWLSYANGYYTQLPESEIKARIYGLVLDDFTAYATEHDSFLKPITPKLKSAVRSNLQDSCHLSAEYELNTWLNGAWTRPISVTNGLYDPEKGTLQKHSSDWFTLVRLPFIYDATAEASRWLAFLHETFRGNAALVSLLQEIFGYCLMPGNDLERFFYFVGPAASGKSTVLGVLRALLGEANCSAVSLEQFGRNFGAWPALNKLANISGEADCGGTNEALIKQWSGRDTVTVDRKRIEPITCQPTAKLIFAGNTYPPFTDPSGGIRRRMLIVPFTRSVPLEERDHDLRERIVTEELSGVFNWALAGRAHLYKTRRFGETAETERASAEQRTFARPEEEFFREELYPAEGAGVRSEDLYTAYRAWATRSGIREPLTRPWFFRQLCTFFPQVKRARVTNGERYWAYRGVALVSGWVETPAEEATSAPN